MSKMNLSELLEGFAIKKVWASRPINTMKFKDCMIKSINVLWNPESNTHLELQWTYRCTPLFNLPTVIHEFFRHKICSDHNEKKVGAFSERLYCSKNFICSYLKYFLISSDEKSSVKVLEASIFLLFTQIWKRAQTLGLEELICNLLEIMML